MNQINSEDGLFNPITVQLRKAGQILICDRDDEPIALAYSWRYDKDGYVVRGVRKKGKPYTLVRFHRAVLENIGYDLTNSVVDHINGVRHDNRKCNLRVCSQKENMRNRRTTNQAGYKGVYWNKKLHCWTARIRVDGRTLYLGSFPSPREAAYCYNMAASQLHGEFAELNEL